MAFDGLPTLATWRDFACCEFVDCTCVGVVVSPVDICNCVACAMREEREGGVLY